MPTGTVEWGTLRQAFLEGQTAMMWHSTGNLTRSKSASFDFRRSRIARQRAQRFANRWRQLLPVQRYDGRRTRSSHEADPVHDSPEQAAAWSIGTGYMGVSPAAYETDALKAYTAEFPPALGGTQPAGKRGRRILDFRDSPRARWLEQRHSVRIDRRKDPAEALAEAQAAA